MKVSVVIEPEEANEGDFGCTVMVLKGDVISLEQLMEVYLAAAKGAGWYVDQMGAVSGDEEFWSDT